MNTKRIVAFVLSVVILFSLIPSAVFPAKAEIAEAQPIEFTITNVKGVADKTVHVEVRVSENSHIASLGLELLFDSSKLLVTDFADGELFGSGMSAINANVSDKVIVSFVTMEPVTEAGTLFSVDFHVSSEEISDKIDLSLNVTEVTDINGDDLDSSFNEGVIEVVDLLYGDLNFDNRVTSVDALMILSAATEEIELTAEAAKAGDVNGDGECTVSDALQVLYFSAELQNDFAIYNLSAPQNLQITQLDGYQFTVSWDYQRDVLGYNVYFDGELVNAELLTDASVTIGVNSNEEYGDDLIPRRVHDSIEQVTTYNVKVTAVNSLKESEKSEIDVTTKRVWSWVTFKDWDGTQIKKARVYYGEDAIEPNPPSREDYVFTGWDKPTTNITDDTVITATYEDARYDFIFRNEDGAELYRQTVIVNGAATPPADPVKTGYTFSGWYTAAEGGEKVEDFTITSQTQDRTVYAHYTINSYNVSFETNGGTAVAGKTAQYKTGITAPTAPTRLGYGFAGWYKDASLSNKWDFAKDVVTENTVLYAKWNPVVITIDKAAVTLNAVGNTAQLTATIAGGSDTLTWSSSNNSVATVSATGLITAKGHGEAIIYVQGTSSERRPVTKVTVNVSKTAWVTTSNLNVRKGPSTSHASIASLSHGSQIAVFGEMTAHGVNGQTGWYYIKTSGGVYGYVSANYITFTKPQLRLPFSGSYRITSHYSSAHKATDMVPTNGDKNLYALAKGTVVKVQNTCTHHENKDKPYYKYDSKRGFGYRYCEHDGGNYVVIEYENGYKTKYCHMRSVSVKAGDPVSAGQVVGVVGNTGASTGAHLHFILYKNNKVVNPETELGLK